MVRLPWCFDAGNTARKPSRLQSITREPPDVWCIACGRTTRRANQQKPVQPFAKKYSAFAVGQSASHPMRGALRNVTHAAASGGKIHNYSCPQCGSTVYWKLSNLPALIAVAVGAMAEPKYPAPSYRFSNSRNMIGFKLMVPWSTSGKAASPKIQTETPPKILVSRNFPISG